VTEGPERSLGDGAAQAAPTAPHATARAGTNPRNGPERFWSKGRVRLGLAVAFVLSVAFHAILVPVRFSSVEVRDVEGEAAIPFDVFTTTAAPPVQPAAVEPPSAPAEPERSRSDETASIPWDAGVLRARDPRDAGTKALDAGVAESRADASSELAADASSGLATDASPELSADAAARSPEALIAEIQSDRVLVMLVVDVGAIRANPVGAQMGYLVHGIPQWEDLLSGTRIDPLRDTDWLVISGPSFVNTGRDVVLVHYSAPDPIIDRAVLSLAHRTPSGGPTDAGVPGVRAFLAHADRAERVILRPQSGVLAVVPPSAAHRVARQLSGARIAAPIRAGDALYLRFVSPHRALPELPEAIQEMRMRVIPRDDGGADVYVEGDTSDAEHASSAASDVAQFVRRHDDPITSLVTHGILDRVEVTAEGPLVKAHLTATRDQLATLVALVGDVLGVQPDDLPAPRGSTGAPSRVR
jgi:hypothetical protein